MLQRNSFLGCADSAGFYPEQAKKNAFDPVTSKICISTNRGLSRVTQFRVLAPMNEHLSDTCCFPVVARRGALLSPLLWTLSVGQRDGRALDLMEVRPWVSMSVPRAGLERACPFFSEGLMGVCSWHSEREVRIGRSGAVLCSPQRGFWLPSLNPLGQQHRCDKGQCSVWLLQLP